MQPDAESLIDADRFASLLGARLGATDDESVTVSLDIEERHLNFLDLAHGGVVFSLADIALSLIANSNQSVALAVDASVSIVRAARKGDTISARATVERTTRSLGWYRVDVENQEGERIARFTGTVFRPASH